MLNAWDKKKSTKNLKIIEGFDLVKLSSNYKFLAERILEWRIEMINDNRTTTEDIAKFDKHFGII